MKFSKYKFKKITLKDFTEVANILNKKQYGKLDFIFLYNSEFKAKLNERIHNNILNY